jgi:hypothetical protein
MHLSSTGALFFDGALEIEYQLRGSSRHSYKLPKTSASEATSMFAGLRLAPADITNSTPKLREVFRRSIVPQKGNQFSAIFQDFSERRHQIVCAALSLWE